MPERFYQKFSCSSLPVSAFMLFLLIAPGHGFAADEPPAITISPTRHDFGSLTLETGAAAKVFTIANAGGADFAVSGIYLPDGRSYSLDLATGEKPCGKTALLAPGESCTFTVFFRPKKDGPLHSEVSVFLGEPAGNRLIVPLAGFGAMCGC